MKYIPFSMKKIPDYGITLIEASAGTGKTFSIILLYLRLLLNIGIKKTYLRPLSINEILVVTFTEASKNELKSRLYKKINKLYQVFTNDTKVENNDLIEIIKDIKNKKKTVKLLKKAKNNIDTAMIYTLHGFFRHILLENKFLCTKYVPSRIISNIKKIQIEATKDFWRKNIYPANKHIIELILNKWQTPKKLYQYISLWINQNNIAFTHNFSKKSNLNQKYSDIINLINQTKKIWIIEKKAIQNIIKKKNINKKLYHDKNIKKWSDIIDSWAEKKTNKCFIPKILKYFQIKAIQINLENQKSKKYIFFISIKKIFTCYNLFFEYFIYLSLTEIYKIIQKKKKEKEVLEFNDLNKIIWQQIKSKNSTIKQNILNQYSVTIIDEFQDIDNLQFNIFYKLYHNVYDKSLILIGDPKQSIYSFRGSNISLYLKLKRKIKKCFFLKKNFRSSKEITKGINILFSRIKKPFIIKDINFQPSTIYSGNKKIDFVVNEVKQPAFNFIYNSEKPITTEEYYTWISRECAYTIYKWLSTDSTEKSFIVLRNQKRRFVEPKDIAILVKNKYEANIISEKLEKKGIKTFYTSHEKNIFNTKEAKELMWIIESMLDLSNELKFQKLLITKIFQKNIHDIHLINNKKKLYFTLLKRLKKYYTIWNKNGISKMIEEIVIDFDIRIPYKRSVENYPEPENIFELSEILNIKNQTITNKFLLLIWFKKKIFQAHDNLNNENRNLKKIKNDDKDLVTITTIYKSKGLEYPIIWIPFLSTFKYSNDRIFYCQKTFKKIIDLKNKKKNQILSQIEAFSENMRLLYVALTRSIVHCSIGIAFIQKKKNISNKAILKKFNTSSLCFLIQKGQRNDIKNLTQELYNIQEPKIIQIQKKSLIKKKKIKKKKINEETHSVPKLLYKIKNPWKKINFSNIIQHYIFQKKKKKEKKIFNKKIILNNKKNNFSEINIHMFPRGKEFGVYLHDIFRKIQFSKTEKIERIIKKLNFLSLSKTYLQKLHKWICMFLARPLSENQLSLNQLKISEYQKELNFIIPITKTLNLDMLNVITNGINTKPITNKEIYLKNISGIFTGSIDLVILWNNKYYIIDYKSNWLGPDYNYYSKENIEKEIIKYHYNLQCQIYSLAIHRYLKRKIKNYDYNIHFGGMFFLFLRGFDNMNHSGIYFTKPSHLLIKSLNKLIYGTFHDTRK